MKARTKSGIPRSQAMTLARKPCRAVKAWQRRWTRDGGPSRPEQPRAALPRKPGGRGARRRWSGADSDGPAGHRPRHRLELRRGGLQGRGADLRGRGPGAETGELLGGDGDLQRLVPQQAGLGEELEAQLLAPV